MDDAALAARTAAALSAAADDEAAELERQEDQQRLRQRQQPGGGGGGLNIRGLAGAADRQQGFAIKGAAAASARELFPNRFGEAAASGGSNGGAANAGRELFAGNLEGRGRPRRKAEDLFL